MNQGSAEISDKVTVLVFKNNYAARTFQIPLRWISQFGILLGLLLGVTTISVFLAGKYYRIAAKTDPSKVQELEQELADLKINIKTLEANSANLPTSAQGPAQNSASPHPESNLVHQRNQISTSSALGSGSSTINSGATLLLGPKAPDSSSTPISIESPKLSWKGKILKMKFALLYNKNDRGNQEGKIIILARGPDILQAYPSNTLNPIGTENLLAPNNGEFFSVSRYREVKADFGPFRSSSSVKEIEIMVFDTEGQMITYQKVPVQKGSSQAQGKPKELKTESAAQPAASGESQKSTDIPETPETKTQPQTDPAEPSSGEPHTSP